MSISKKKEEAISSAMLKNLKPEQRQRAEQALKEGNRLPKRLGDTLFRLAKEGKTKEYKTLMNAYKKDPKGMSEFFNTSLWPKKPSMMGSSKTVIGKTK